MRKQNTRNEAIFFLLQHCAFEMAQHLLRAAMRLRVHRVKVGARLMSEVKIHPDDPERSKDKTAKILWTTSIVGTASIFGVGLATGNDTLFPAWAFFHSCGACASYVQRQPFDTFMHSAVMLGVLIYWGKDALLSGDSAENVPAHFEKGDHKKSPVDQ